MKTMLYSHFDTQLSSEVVMLKMGKSEPIVNHTDPQIP